MMNVYAIFEDFMAIPVVKGIKTKQSDLPEQKKLIALKH
jgi:hypothetical protein